MDNVRLFLNNFHSNISERKSKYKFISLKKFKNNIKLTTIKTSYNFILYSV